MLVVCLLGGVLVTEVAPKKSEPKRSSSSGAGSTLLLSLLESFFPAVVDTGSVSTEGLEDVSGTED